MGRMPSFAERSIVLDLKRGTLSMAAIARRHGVSESAVADVARRNGVATRVRNDWTEDEIAFLRASYFELGPRKCAEMLERHSSHGSVCHKARELGLETRVGPYGKPKHMRFTVLEGGADGKQI